MEPLGLHREAVFIDATCPLARERRHLEAYRRGGCTATAPTVGGFMGAAETLGDLGRWLGKIKRRDDLLQVKHADDIATAKKTGRLGLIFHFQGTEPIETDLDLADSCKEIGIGVIQLTYNVRNREGDGCEERTDAGLSRFGIELIERLNRARIIVDCSHTGYRTPVFDTPLGRASLQVCYDASFPEPTRIYALKGAVLNLVISAGPSAARESWEITLRQRAKENAMWTVYCSTVGRQRDSSFFGGSKIVDPRGLIVLEAKFDAEDFVVGQIDMEEALLLRRQRLMFRDLTPKLFAELAALTAGGSEPPSER